MASLIGETVTLTVSFSGVDTFQQTFVVGAGAEISGQSINKTVGGFNINGTISVDVGDDDFTLTFNGNQNLFGLTYKLTSLADQSAAKVTNAVETAKTITNGANDTMPPTFGDTDGGFATGGFNMFGFQPGVNISQSVQLTFTDASGPPTLDVNKGSNPTEGGLDTITTLELDTNDTDTPNTSLVYKVTAPTANGTLFLDADNDGVVDGGEERVVGGTFTQDDINTGRVKYLHNGGESASDSFGFSVTDGVTTLAGKTFNFNVLPVNDAPTITGLDGDARVWSEDLAVNVGLDQGLNAVIADVDDSDFNGGSLTVSFNKSGLPEDQLLVANLGFVTVVGNTVLFNGDTVGTVSGGTGGGDLVISFNSAAATAGAVTGILQAIQYKNNGGENPSSGDLFAFVTVSDGTDNSAASKVKITVQETDDPAVAADDAFTTTESTTITTFNVLNDNGNGVDTDPDSSLNIIEVNGTANVGSAITLASGALLTLNADGTFSYDPNGKFNYLPGATSGATTLTATDTFTYTLAGGSTASVTVTVNGVDSDGDELTGTTGNDTLDGGIGIDTMTGGLGDDRYIVDNVGDVVVELAGGGNDRVMARSTNYVLADGLEIEQLTTTSAAGKGAINLTGNALAQEIVGNAAANTLRDGGGAGDSLRGLAGDDIYQVYSAATTIVEVAGQGTDRVMANITYSLAADDDIELLTTTSSAGKGSINLTGNALAQEIIGNAGANTLKDGGGAGDSLRGLAGNDIYQVYSASTTIVEVAGQGTDRVMANITYSLAADDDIELLTTTSSAGKGAVNLTGNALAQEIIGNAGANTLKDGGGAGDSLRGLAGNDIYQVYSAATTIVEVAGQGTDRVMANITYSLAADDDIELLTTTSSAGKGAVNLTGNTLAQEIIGNAGANILHDGGKGGADTLRGLGGNDVYRVYNSGDVIVEAAGQGTDHVIAAVDYTLAAGVSVEQLTTNGSAGTSGIDLVGNEFVQDIAGNAGENVIDGKGGSDKLAGGSGKDFFVFSTALGATNVDTISDFNVAADTIRLENAVFTALTTTGTLATSAFRANTTGSAGDGSDRIIYETDTGKLFYDADGTGATVGVHFATLTSGLAINQADFVVI